MSIHLNALPVAGFSCGFCGLYGEVDVFSHTFSLFAMSYTESNFIGLQDLSFNRPFILKSARD